MVPVGSLCYIGLLRKEVMADKGFLDEFLGREGVPTPDAKTKNTVRHDKWDREDYNRLIAEMDELGASEDRLTDVVDTGASMMADTYFSLVKSVPELRGADEVRPSYMINRAVMGEAMDLKEHEELRMYSVNDEIQAGLACVSMEPELEIIYDKLQQEQKLAKEIEDQLQQMSGMRQEERDLDDMIQQAQEEGDQSAAEDFQQQQGRIQEAMEQLQQQIDQNVNDLQDQLQNAGPMIKEMMKGALEEASDQAQDMEAMTQTWGLDPGAFHRLPPKERLALAQRMNNDKFRRIAQLFGPMSRMAFAEQQRKTLFSRDEVYDVELGADLANILPTEFLYLDDEALEMDFLRRYVEHSLLQYKLRGTEKVAKGGIIFNEDGSGSMGGDKEIWAKAVGLCLLHISKQQNRSFYGIHFGGPGVIQEFDFRDPKNVDLEEVIAFAELFFNGGTDFMTPLSRSLDLLVEEYKAQGCVNGDIVFCTDGICGVGDEWLQNFKEKQAEMGFRVWGIMIGGNPDSEPFKTICDGRTFTIKDLMSGDDVRDMFREV